MPFARSDGGGSAPRASDSSGGPRGQVDFSPRRGGYFAIEVYFTVSYLISSSSSRLPEVSERSSPSFQRIGWTSIRSNRPVSSPAMFLRITEAVPRLVSPLRCVWWYCTQSSSPDV